MAKPVKKKIATPKKTGVKKPKVEENTLSKFSEAFDSMLKDREVKHKEDAARARKLLPGWIADLPTATPDGLIILYDNALQGGFSNHYLMVVLAEWRDAIRNEMLRRMTVSPKLTKGKK